MMNYVGLLLFFLQIAQSAPVPDIPDSPGVYYRQESGKWASLAIAPMAKTTTRGMGLFVETGGFTNLETDVICPGAKAVTRIASLRPTFYARGIGSSGDAVLVQFTQKNKSRTFHKSSADASVENKIGIKKQALRKASIAVYAEGVFSLTPDANLKPGEYLLILGDAALSYDFGIDPQR